MKEKGWNLLTIEHKIQRQTRAQSCELYGFGTLHPKQVLGGSLPLITPAFRRFHFRRQVPVRP